MWPPPRGAAAQCCSWAEPRDAAAAENQLLCWDAVGMLTKKQKPSPTFLMESHELWACCRKQDFHITAANSPKKVLSVTGKRWNRTKS